MKTILTTAIVLLSFNLFGQNPSRIVTETNSAPLGIRPAELTMKGRRTKGKLSGILPI